MNIIKGDIFSYWHSNNIILISGGWQLNQKGNLILARGAACQLKHRNPYTAVTLGNRRSLSRDMRICEAAPRCWYIPTHRLWYEPSTYVHVASMLQTLRRSINRDTNYYITRIGCGTGKLDWDMVRPIMKALFRDFNNFNVVVR